MELIYKPIAPIDFSKAFDSVWRIRLWGNLIQNGINGKGFQVIYIMYQCKKILCQCS